MPHQPCYASTYARQWTQPDVQYRLPDLAPVAPDHLIVSLLVTTVLGTTVDPRRRGPPLLTCQSFWVGWLVRPLRYTYPSTLSSCLCRPSPKRPHLTRCFNSLLLTTGGRTFGSPMWWNTPPPESTFLSTPPRDSRVHYYPLSETSEVGPGVVVVPAPNGLLPCQSRL